MPVPYRIPNGAAGSVEAGLVSARWRPMARPAVSIRI
ncbi:hypothetical protein QO016_003235 [Methylobacterium persicinum]|uniref:Uncharacterized protein n=1 Tax=Methylobacterium persicinum TaxID=374426 RepID=A0ABU0HN33_9HYPH|nr:hypothetical protein [Methylobacterium persicinum]